MRYRTLISPPVIAAFCTVMALILVVEAIREPDDTPTVAARQTLIVTDIVRVNAAMIKNYTDEGWVFEEAHFVPLNRTYNATFRKYGE